MPQAQQLGRYHLLDRIAYGGMAEIFRAKTFDSAGQIHYVAVKRLLSHLITDDEFLAMLVDEAKISATLQHPNIARVYEFARAQDEYFMAMEYIDGKDVRALLEKARAGGRPIPAEHAAYVAMEVATALHAAHIQRDATGAALRIVHRDVSPSNCLCSYRGDVKLCDFGIAKATLTRVQTKTGVIKGKVKYMSPEQAMGRKLDHRSDIFSLGTVLYEMLTLQAPFQAPTEVELIFCVRDAKKRPVRDLNPECPRELQEIVDKAMTRSRSNRFQSGEQMALELRMFLDQHKPGYRRSHFSRYMRRQFEAEIERELRILEAYTVDEDAVADVGENLIADVLGPDAPFTRFTPVGKPHPADPALTSATQMLPDLHDRNTVILDVGERSRARRRDLFDRETMIIPRARWFHEAETRLVALPEKPLRKTLPGLADETVQGFRKVRVDETQPAPQLDPGELGDLEASDTVRDADAFASQSTVVDEPAPLPPPPSDDPDAALRTFLQQSETTAIVRLRLTPSRRSKEDGSEETALPLDEDDLEEI